MAGYRPTDIPRPLSDEDFEKNCVPLFAGVLADPNVKRVGVSGQGQQGVDLVGRRNRLPNHIVGIQCKVRTGGKLSETDVRTEVKEALNYRPRLREYFIVTTARDDIKLDQLAQSLTAELHEKGHSLEVQIWGWDTLQERIDQYPAARQAFDPTFTPSSAAQDQKLETLVTGQQSTHEKLDFLIDLARQKVNQIVQIPTAHADRDLTESLSKILQRRGFPGTDVGAELADLADRAIGGDLVLASNDRRAEACERAARANATAEHSAKARELREHAARLDPNRDLLLVDALLLQCAGEHEAAQALLASRESADARSTLLLCVRRQKGPEATLAWIMETGFGAAQCNCSGALVLVSVLVENQRFEDALREVNAMSAELFDQCPVLLTLRANTTLASILPPDQKIAPFQGLPPNPRSMQLAAGSTALQRLRAARQDIERVISKMVALDLRDAEPYLTEFALWLRLEDAETHDFARAQLVREIADPELTLRRVRLALAYDVPFNSEALQRHLQTLREEGNWNTDARFAAFLLAYHADDPAAMVGYFEANHDDLFTQTDLVLSELACIEVEALARCGRFEEARAHIELHGSQLTAEQTARLMVVVAHIESDDEVESLRQAYESSQALNDLRPLVAALRSRGDSRLLAVYGALLARQTQSLPEFSLALRALYRAGHHAEAIRLTEEFPEIYALRDEFKSYKAWSLFSLGRVTDAALIARPLWESRGDATDRELAVNTAIESGDWGYLQAIVARALSRIDDLPAKDLMRLARIALEAGSPYVDRFRDAALQKSPEDPVLNIAAYGLATDRGEEASSVVAQTWLQKAIDMAGPDGPVQRVSLKTIADQAPLWNEHTDRVDRMLRDAEAPIFIAAKGVRRQLMDLTYGQAVRNSDPQDRRIRYPVFANSGARPPADHSMATSVAFDVTALITLEYLGLLETAFTAFDRTVVAPRTLSALFIQRQFLRFHQPSQIAKADRIQKLIAAGKLKVLTTSPDSTGPIAKEVGRELASLLAAARRNGGVVIRSAPVTKVGSFLEEIVDLSEYSFCLTDTLAVLHFLTGQGEIAADARALGEAYLKQHDQGWNAAASIAAESSLYLDDLALTYLDHVGLLEPLTRAAREIFVFEDLDNRTRELQQHGKQREALLHAIERIRSAVATGIEKGRVHFSTRVTALPSAPDEGGEEDEEEEEDAETHPTLDLMGNLAGIDLVLVDDRALNKLSHWTDNGGLNVPCAAVVDLLAMMLRSGKLSQPAYWRALHQLRVGGFYTVPVTAAELVHHVGNAPIAEDSLRETPELRAIREGLLWPRIHECFLPSERRWLDEVRMEVLRAIRQLWGQAQDADATAHRASWLLSILPNPMEWSSKADPPAVRSMLRQQFVAQVGMLALASLDSGATRKRYLAWVTEELIEPIELLHPQLWEAVVEFLKTYIPQLLEAQFGKAES